MNQAAFFTDRRLNGERRCDSTGVLSPRRWRSRRRCHRRDDRLLAACGYVDWYEPKWLLAAAAVVLLSCLDAGATLALFGRWAKEQGYLQDTVLKIDAALFLIFKLTVAGAGLLMLVGQYKFKLFQWASGARLLPGCLAVYGLLVTYELLSFFAG